MVVYSHLTDKMINYRDKLNPYYAIFLRRNIEPDPRSMIVQFLWAQSSQEAEEVERTLNSHKTMCFIPLIKGDLQILMD